MHFIELELQIYLRYRLSPEHTYPIPINDCWAATDYIMNNADGLNIDANRIFMIGDSAGNIFY
jgi:acetyl esterase